MVMRLIVLVIGAVAAVAAALTAVAIALASTERGRAATATVSERLDPQVTQVRRAIDPGVQAATKALRAIPIVSDRLPAEGGIDETVDAAIDAADEAIAGAQEAVESIADATDDAVKAAAS
jgi:hypothetical protein